MKLTRGRVEKVARDLVEAMSRSRTVVFLKDRESVRQTIARELDDELRREEEREEAVRRRISAMRKAPRPGSAEWDQLFHSLMNEEYLRDSET